MYTLEPFQRQCWGNFWEVGFSKCIHTILSWTELDLCFLYAKMDKEDRQQGPCGLILEPTRELALQVHKHLKSAARHTNIQVRKWHAYC